MLFVRKVTVPGDPASDSDRLTMCNRERGTLRGEGKKIPEITTKGEAVSRGKSNTQIKKKQTEEEPA